MKKITLIMFFACFTFLSWGQSWCGDSYMLGVVVFLVVVDAVRVQPLNWEPTYSLDTKNPFDLYVFDREMKSFFPHQKVEKVTTSPFMYVSEHHEAVNYLVIKPTFFNLSDTALINEVKNGSNLFLSSENMGYRCCNMRNCLL